MEKQGASSSSIEEAYRSQSGSLTRFLGRFLDSRFDIEDVLQEAFLKAYEAERKTDIKSPSAFLFKTAKNLALNAISMRQRRRTDPVADLEQLPIVLGVDVIGNLSPESQQELQDEWALAEKYVAQLTPRVREVFILRKVYGYSHKEISSQLGIAVSTVEKHIASGLLGMKKFSSESGCGESATVVARDRKLNMEESHD